MAPNLGKEENLDTAEKAIRILETARRLEPANVGVLYNLASIKETRKRTAGARRDWETYLKLKTVPKDNFYIYVYKRLKRTQPPAPSAGGAVPQVPGGIRLGDDFSRIEKKWGGKYSRGFKLGAEDRDVGNGWAIDLKVMVKGNVRVVAVGGTIEIVEQEFSPVESISKIIKRLGVPGFLGTGRKNSIKRLGMPGKIVSKGYSGIMDLLIVCAGRGAGIGTPYNWF